MSRDIAMCVCVTCSWDKPVGLVVIAHICVQLHAILNMFCLDWEVRPCRFQDPDFQLIAPNPLSALFLIFSVVSIREIKIASPASPSFPAMLAGIGIGKLFCISIVGCSQHVFVFCSLAMGTCANSHSHNWGVFQPCSRRRICCIMLHPMQQCTAHAYSKKFHRC